jgi:hypothetical protein
VKTLVRRPILAHPKSDCLMPAGAEDLQSSAHTALAVLLRYAQAGSSLAQAALGGSQAFELFRHYPARDVVDRAAGTRFYYHAHRRDEPEHGHFHLFVDGPKEGEFAHLAALSIDVRGQPMRWFTTNRWVTGESWRPAVDMLPALGNFAVHTQGRLAPVAQWLTAMVQVFSDELATLLQARDACVEPLIACEGAETVFENRVLEVLSECPAQLPLKLAQMGL